MWNRLPAQVGCTRQVLGAGALGRPRGMGWGGRWERGSGWGTHVNPWLIHVNVWQKPLQYCKVISLQLTKINEIIIIIIRHTYTKNSFAVYLNWVYCILFPKSGNPREEPLVLIEVDHPLFILFLKNYFNWSKTLIQKEHLSWVYRSLNIHKWRHSCSQDPGQNADC